MMPNVVRGDRMGGLVAYLVGPGRANEHEEPHLVAGDDALMAWYDDATLDANAATAIAQHLERPRKAFGVDVPGGHVWHCSLSLRAEEGQLTDEQWGAIATDFVRAMEFDDNEGSKAPCRWIAVRHGQSTAGNDHVHLVVNLVREDGTRASIHNDFRRAQTAARALEKKHGLEQLESARAERGTRGYHPAERQAQARARARAAYERAGAREGAWSELPAARRHSLIEAAADAGQPRERLAVAVRGCAAASETEAEFVRRMRAHGLLVRPRFAEGRTDVVTGYSVARRPESGERPIWYGGGHLARDLTLPRLRESWPDTPEEASAAAAEWTAAKRGRRVVAPGRERTVLDEAAQRKTDASISELVEQLRSVPLDDRHMWEVVARQTAGALAAWSNATEATPGPLAAAAEAVSRSAQTYRSHPKPWTGAARPLGSAALLLASASRGGIGVVAEVALARQMLRLVQALHDAARAAEQLRQAQHLAAVTRSQLVAVRDGLASRAAAGVPVPAVAAPAAQLDPEAQAVLDRLRASQADGPRPRSPIPASLDERRRQTAQVRPDRGVER